MRKVDNWGSPDRYLSMDMITDAVESGVGAAQDEGLKPDPGTLQVAPPVGEGQTHCWGCREK